MSFLTPIAFLGAALAIPILLLYMLRLRRREVVVSSTYLWQQILQDTEANTPWQRLRRNILLFLQLLILFLLVLALARPFIIIPTVSAGKTALLLDASASMNATDMDGRTRFEVAKDEARRVISLMSPADTISIIRVGESAEPLTSYTNDAGELRAAIDAAQVDAAEGDWDTALTLAAAGAAGAEDFSIVLIGDGGLGEVGTFTNLPEPIYLPIGNSSDNLAITALATGTLPGQQPELFAQVTNYSGTDAEIALVVRLDGVLAASGRATIPARSRSAIPFGQVEDEFTTIEAELSFGDEVTDYLELDNRAWAVVDNASSRRVLLLSADNNIFLEQVLRSMPEVQVFRGDTARQSLPDRPYDLYIFNGWLPNALPDGDMLIVNPPNGTSLFELGAESSETRNITILQPDHPLMTFADFDNVNLRVFQPVTAAWGDAIIEADGGTLLLAGEEDGRQIAIMGLDIRESDLPLQIAWPILMANAMNWFTPSDILTSSAGLHVGDPVTIRPPLEADRIEIQLPDGQTRDISVDNESIIFSETVQPGLYTLNVFSADEIMQSQPFALNLFSERESNIEPAPDGSIQLGGIDSDAEADEQLGQLEFWSIVALLALVVLLIEWVVYHRRLQVPTVLSPIRRPVRA